LKNILGYKYELSNIEYIIRKIKQEFEYVDFAISTTKPKEIILVTNLLNEDNYFAKNTKRSGLTVKMFTTNYDNNKAIVKVYMYDPACKMLAYSVETNFQNEVVFQNYAKQMNKPLDFISQKFTPSGKYVVINRILYQTAKSLTMIILLNQNTDVYLSLWNIFRDYIKKRYLFLRKYERYL
jgi:hypothetical protein